jgi:hypothetical protein
MVADFLISQQENKDDELSPELEAMIKDAAAGVYIGDHLMLSQCYALTGRDSVAGSETVRRNSI